MNRLMIKPYEPMSNYERQQRFCNSHPGYYTARKRTQRALAKSAWETQLAALQAAAQPADAPAPPLPATAAYEAPTGC
jgi:hypothetical protein